MNEMFSQNKIVSIFRVSAFKLLTYRLDAVNDPFMMPKRPVYDA